MSDGLRDKIAEVLSGHPIGSGYYGTNVGMDEAQEMADELIDDLGLRFEVGDGREDRYRRVVGLWEVDR